MNRPRWGLAVLLALVFTSSTAAALYPTDPPETVETAAMAYQVPPWIGVTTTAAPTTTSTSTTTTRPPPPPAPTTTLPPSTTTTAPVFVAASVTLPCGGRLPTCQVLDCESGGNDGNPWTYDLRAENASTSASGKWQITDGTWASFAGVGHASWASEAVQDEKAAQLWAGGTGSHHWAACL